MTSTENYLMSCLALATDALAPGAPVELKHQAAAALRGLAVVVEGGAGIAAAASSAPATATAAASSAPATATAAASSAPAAPPDFFSVLLQNLQARLPEIVPADELAKARAEAQAEGFKMPAGIDLGQFVASQAKARA